MSPPRNQLRRVAVIEVLELLELLRYNGEPMSAIQQAVDVPNPTGPRLRRQESAHSQSLFRSLAILALAGHLLILAVTTAAAIWPLVIINVFSVMLYSTALLLNARRWYVAVLGIGLLEVSVHAVVATVLLGWGSGFHIYLLALVPLVFFFDPWSLRTRAWASGAIIVFYVLFSWYAQQRLADDARWFIEWFRYGNLTVGSVVIAALSYYYGTAVRKAQIDLEEKNRQLDELARTDPLTGLANRRESTTILEYESARSLRASDGFAVALIDIDYFKSINDEYGHDAGDLVLADLAQLLRSSLRAQDSVARWGGEEFLLILPQTRGEGAAVVSEKVRSAVENHSFALSSGEIHVTATVGVAIYDAASGIEAAVRAADESLYQGKQRGRNCVCHAWDQKQP